MPRTGRDDLAEAPALEQRDRSAGKRLAAVDVATVELDQRELGEDVGGRLRRIVFRLEKRLFEDLPRRARLAAQVERLSMREEGFRAPLTAVVRCCRCSAPRLGCACHAPQEKARADEGGAELWGGESARERAVMATALRDHQPALDRVGRR